MREKLITLSYIFNGDVHKIKQAIECNLDIKVNKQFIKLLSDRNIEVLTILDKDYPKELLELHEPPYVLYCAGDLNLLKKSKYAIVGSRNNNNYSEIICKKLVENLKNDIVIVSGLAKGIDSYAHLFAIRSEKSTIAVIGSGLDKIYPACNIKLADDIMNNHLIITEYPIGVRASKHHFPLRNRIIAALCSNIYVIEAAKKSGSIITANIALDLGRNIYCAPGSIFDENFEGSHQLINDGAYLLDFRSEG